tara:strand:- start:822 stop:1022 length:201 start_codon:yes stop_codon:yes gene_type:complete
MELYRNKKEMIERGCIRCKEIFEYEGIIGVGRGNMTRRYCDQCKILQHRDEAILYKKRKKLNNTII